MKVVSKTYLNERISTHLFNRTMYLRVINGQFYARYLACLCGNEITKIYRYVSGILYTITTYFHPTIRFSIYCLGKTATVGLTLRKCYVLLRDHETYGCLRCQTQRMGKKRYLINPLRVSYVYSYKIVRLLVTQYLSFLGGHNNIFIVGNKKIIGIVIKLNYRHGGDSHIAIRSCYATLVNNKI